MLLDVLMEPVLGAGQEFSEKEAPPHADRVRFYRKYRHRDLACSSLPF